MTANEIKAARIVEIIDQLHRWAHETLASEDAALLLVQASDMAVVSASDIEETVEASDAEAIEWHENGEHYGE